MIIKEMSQELKLKMKDTEREQRRNDAKYKRLYDEYQETVEGIRF